MKFKFAQSRQTSFLIMLRITLHYGHFILMLLNLLVYWFVFIILLLEMKIAPNVFPVRRKLCPIVLDLLKKIIHLAYRNLYQKWTLPNRLFVWSHTLVVLFKVLTTLPLHCQPIRASHLKFEITVTFID